MSVHINSLFKVVMSQYCNPLNIIYSPLIIMNITKLIEDAVKDLFLKLTDEGLEEVKV